ncbi:hypothetical protein PGT21_005891 [Puccinia graminis f. sp. tritici]|uniref:Uncharacterized protein n=1 Tax=Puccinia graminis f. sp. tritici TaxID=56615 RepID=A0A5B0LYH2_PUCGR|nr:hypothetical protein PGT21_005891 [Puccinia graminis f. sp. tritici]
MILHLDVLATICVLLAGCPMGCSGRSLWRRMGHDVEMATPLLHSVSTESKHASVPTQYISPAGKSRFGCPFDDPKGSNGIMLSREHPHRGAGTSMPYYGAPVIDEGPIIPLATFRVTAPRVMGVSLDTTWAFTARFLATHRGNYDQSRLAELIRLAKGWIKETVNENHPFVTKYGAAVDSDPVAVSRQLEREFTQLHFDEVIELILPKLSTIKKKYLKEFGLKKGISSQGHLFHPDHHKDRIEQLYKDWKKSCKPLGYYFINLWDKLWRVFKRNKLD